MSTATQIKLRSFCWIDLPTDKPEVAAKFYTALFGWEAREVMNNDKGNYSMFFKDGHDVGGFYRLEGRPTWWASYVLVEDVDAMVKKAVELSGKVYMPVTEVMPGARMAVVADPTGAALALWESKDGSKTLRDVPNTLCWNELLTHDTQKSGDFYTQLLGWTTKSDGHGGAGYTEFLNDGDAIAGMMAFPPDSGQMPPFWMPYFMVEDVDAMAARAKELGGKAMIEGLDVQGVGRIANIMDPVGGGFGMVQFAAQ